MKSNSAARRSASGRGSLASHSTTRLRMPASNRAASASRVTARRTGSRARPQRRHQQSGADRQGEAADDEPDASGHVILRSSPSRDTDSRSSSTFFTSSEQSPSWSWRHNRSATRYSSSARGRSPARSASLPSSLWTRPRTQSRVAPASAARSSRLGRDAVFQRDERRAVCVAPASVFALGARPRIAGETRQSFLERGPGIGRAARLAAPYFRPRATADGCAETAAATPQSPAGRRRSGPRGCT